MKPAYVLLALVVAALVIWTVVAIGGSDEPRGEPAMTDTPEAGADSGAKSASDPAVTPEPKRSTSLSKKVATFGAGCFWCVEAVFQELDGVHSVKSGYMGGFVDNPTYKQVCGGETGHAEVAQIEYDPAKVSFAELLEVFWKTHDPTTLNRQGADVGTQYRSAIFFHDEDQKKEAAAYKQKLDDAGAFPAPIVTEIVPISEFWVAENYHQDYYRDNPDAGYCRAVIKPKLEKFRKVFGTKLKD